MRACGVGEWERSVGVRDRFAENHNDSSRERCVHVRQEHGFDADYAKCERGVEVTE